MHWRDTNLGEICDEVQGLIQTGPFGSQLHESDYSVEGTPVVMPKDIIGGEIETSSIARISKSHVDRLKKHKLKAGDIVYGRRGDIGREALVGDEQAGWLCGTGCLRISLGDTTIDPGFLHYYLQEKSMIRWIANHAVGATMPNLNTTILRSVPIRMPEIAYQRDIAAVLSVYDSLIRNNSRRIKVLETIAQTIYNEWFVDFRFPGHKKDKLGKDNLPVGWELKNITNTGIFRLCTDRVRHLSGEKMYLDTSSIEGITIMKEPLLVTKENIPSRAQFQPKKDSVWFARMANTYKVLVFTSNSKFEIENYILSSGMFGLETEYKYLAFLFFTINSNYFHQLKDQNATGSTQVSLTNAGFEKIKNVIPPVDLIEKYSEAINPSIEEILLLQKENQRLKGIRDLLIPQLVTGKLEIKI